MGFIQNFTGIVNSRYLFFSFCIFCCFCTPSKELHKSSDEIVAASLHPTGRYRLLKDQGLELVSSAVHFGFTFEGTECRIMASIPNNEGHNYLQYELDGEYQQKIKISANSKQPVFLTAKTGGRHTIWLYKATEAHTGGIFIQKITGKNIKPIQKSSSPIIEFIGNSITCGAAADPSDVPCGTGVYHDQHNAYYSYGARVGREIGAEFTLSSVSGIGVYRNWNNNGPTMPEVFDKLDFQDNNSEKWDFSLFKPKVVSIALGTNDFSNGDGIKKRLPFDSAGFVTAYVQFVQFIKNKYPNIQIALLSSPMLTGAPRTFLQNCLTAVKEKTDSLAPGYKKTALFFFDPMRARGCNGHPNVEDHGLLAQQLLPFFKRLLQ